MAGNDTNPLLGFIETGRKLSTEEADQVERSEKKVKIGEGKFTGESSGPISYADIYTNEGKGAGKDTSKLSYKQSLTGVEEGSQRDSGHASMEADGDDTDGEYEGLSVVEKMVGQYECPQFILSDKEEERIQRPWRQGLIVKLMGRRIGYKALETRLKQLWVRKGVISIIDLGGEYFLVYFTNEEDYNHALEDGPWMIYDHYLIAREWSPNFHPSDATIEKAAVWVRIPDLPIEYYDAKVLHYIGDRIGETVKVDKNTLYQERGKYARVCVEVDLNKPLLAMFELKGKIYKVEYEGLHMLCRNCGKFGHYIEGCPEKKITSANTRSTTENVQPETGAEEIAGPWVVVQKPRRPRKAKEVNNKDGAAMANDRITGTGTRFDVLEQLIEDPEIAANNNDEPIIVESTTANHAKSRPGKEGERSGKHVAAKKGKAADFMGENLQRNEKNGTPTLNKQQSQQENNNGALTRNKIQGTHEIIKSTPNDYTGKNKPTPPKSNERNIPNILSHEGPHHMTRPPDQQYLEQSPNNDITNGPKPYVVGSAEPNTGLESMEFVQETPNLTQQEGGAKSMELA
ncbi:hypothetical protein P8452_63561 [Trifolium repens]|nr:hypothetical protein P8452_63561 [Trifolium repens]